TENSFAPDVVLVLAGQKVQSLDIPAVVEDGPLVFSVRSDRVGQELPGILRLESEWAQDHGKFRGNRILLAALGFSGVYQNRNRKPRRVAKEGPGSVPQFILHDFATPITQTEVDQA